MITTRSDDPATSARSALVSVVLPVEVPPATRMLARAATPSRNSAAYDSTVLVDCMDITNQAQRRCALPFVELAFPYEFELIRQRAIYDNALGARVHLSFFCVHYKRAIGSDVAET